MENRVHPFRRSSIDPVSGIHRANGYYSRCRDLCRRSGGTFHKNKGGLKAAVRVNTAMLEFYWSVGRDLVALRAEERWGTGVVKQFALDMRQAFPNETGFSYSNVKYMKQWYSSLKKNSRLLAKLRL